MNEFKTIPCEVHITCVATGETRIHHDDWILPDEEGFSSRFVWADGNFACDCNRKLFFERAAGIEPEDDDTPCGDDGYAVTIKDSAGNVLYADDEEDDQEPPAN